MIDLPKEQREAAFAVVRRNFEEALNRPGQDPEQTHAWLDQQMRGIRALVTEMEATTRQP